MLWRCNDVTWSEYQIRWETIGRSAEITTVDGDLRASLLYQDYAYDGTKCRNLSSRANHTSEPYKG